MRAPTGKSFPVYGDNAKGLALAQTLTGQQCCPSFAGSDSLTVPPCVYRASGSGLKSAGAYAAREMYAVPRVWRGIQNRLDPQLGEPTRTSLSIRAHFCRSSPMIELQHQVATSVEPNK